jgi:hypothetical protein
MDFFRWILFLVIIYAAFNALRYSRGWRKAAEAKDRGTQQALMNLYLGAMLISMGTIQLIYYEGSNARIVIGAVFALLGLFNVYGGYRNYRRFQQ